jgi:hypothetical protein
MSRKCILAIAAIAALGFSTLLATDADARGGGGGHGSRGGGHSRSFHGHSYGRGAFHGRVFSRSSRTASFGRGHYYPRPYPGHATSSGWGHKSSYYPGYQIQRLLQEEPTFSQMFVSHVLARTARVEEDLIDQLFNSTEKRLARLLLLSAKKVGRNRLSRKSVRKRLLRWLAPPGRG